jgi:hypothetical protein
MMPMNAPINSANQARTPVTESDEALTARVDQMSPLLLALSAVHMSGDLSIIRSGLKTYPPAFNGDTSGSLSEADVAKIRALGLDAIKAWRDAGCPSPYRPSEDELHEMIEFLIGLEISADYVPLICEDMSYNSLDDRAFNWNIPVTDLQKSKYPTVVIGAGMSGMLLGMRLKQAGLPFVSIRACGSMCPVTLIPIPSFRITNGRTSIHGKPICLIISANVLTVSGSAIMSVSMSRSPALIGMRRTSSGRSRCATRMARLKRCQLKRW